MVELLLFVVVMIVLTMAEFMVIFGEDGREQDEQGWGCAEAWWLLPREKEVVVWLSCCYCLDMIVVFDVVVVLCGEGALSDIRKHLACRRTFCRGSYTWELCARAC